MPDASENGHPWALFLTMEAESLDALADRLLDLSNHLSASGTGRLTFAGIASRGQLDVTHIGGEARR
jgi:hypothetical protein